MAMQLLRALAIVTLIVCMANATPALEECTSDVSYQCDEESLAMVQKRAQKLESSVGSAQESAASVAAIETAKFYKIHYKITGFSSHVSPCWDDVITQKEFTRKGRIHDCETGCLQKDTSEDWHSQTVWCEGSVTGLDPEVKIGLDAWEDDSENAADRCTYNWDSDDCRMFDEETIGKQDIPEMNTWYTRHLGSTDQGHTMSYMYKLTEADTATCTIYGDPHVISFDKSQVKALSLLSMEERTHASGGSQNGDFWLVKSPDVHIQGRFDNSINNNGKNRTFLKEVAIGGSFLEHNVLIFGTEEGKATWNGEQIFSAAPAEFHNKFISGKYYQGVALVQDPGRAAPTPGYDMTLPSGVKLVINRGKNGLGIKITMSARQGGQDGQCGNFNGIKDDDNADLISSRIDAEISRNQLLFPHAPIRPATCTIYGDPVMSFDEADAKAPSKEASSQPHGSLLDSLPNGLPEKLEVLLSLEERTRGSAESRSGDFWIVKSPDVQIQGRFDVAEIAGENRNLLQEMGIGGSFLGGNVLNFVSQTGKATWNGKEIFRDSPTFLNDFVSGRSYEGELVQDPSQAADPPSYDISLPSGVELVVNRGTDGLVVKITMSPQQDGQSGICGNFNGRMDEDSSAVFASRMNAERTFLR